MIEVMLVIKNSFEYLNLELIESINAKLDLVRLALFIVGKEIDVFKDYAQESMKLDTWGSSFRFDIWDRHLVILLQF